MGQNSITYEQPLNEAMRICLRLESLFQQLNEYRHQPSVSSSQIALTALLKALNVIDRPDLRPKLTQTLTQQSIALSQLERSPHVDHKKLSDLLQHVNQLIDQLHHSPGKIGESLRNNPFLNQIRLHLLNPSGPCNFTTPAYSLWLEQSSEMRIVNLQQWASVFDQLNNIVTTLLRITRDSATAQKAITQNGLYQQSLDPNASCQLIRLTLPVSDRIDPEISVGKHRLVIRLWELDTQQDNPNQNISKDVAFDLSICRM